MKAASLLLGLAGLIAAMPVKAQSGRVPASDNAFSITTGAFDTTNGVLLPGSGTIIGAPIALHNYLHFKQAVDKLHADFVAMQRQDGGTLTPAHDAALRARYFDLTRQIRNWIDAGRN